MPSLSCRACRAVGDVARRIMNNEAVRGCTASLSFDVDRQIGAHGVARDAAALVDRHDCSHEYRYRRH
ncbi:hypothetical protein [Burkholderia stagnalis]|uniref:hypothetical protein n=1 Tax=Burkholderia stagnalis TaxID=1503054 RepID=UPI000759D475|nr:hypothetical protein [Burkholderia stagnalis]KVN58374.1 hypothetical protein WT14_04255 [Burkholderia stagnalis]